MVSLCVLVFRKISETGPVVKLTGKQRHVAYRIRTKRLTAAMTELLLLTGRLVSK